MKILVTGAAGFIGYHVARKLLESGYFVHGLDNLSDYYDVRLKQARLAQLRTHENFAFELCDIADAAKLKDFVTRTQAEIIVHLAAQGGVRYSLTHPQSYVSSNLVGFANLLEAARAAPPRHLLYASSSSVYGGSTRLPFSEDDPADKPLSLYAATKRSNEAMAHSYSHLFGIPMSGLRFFTVYGEWGRPDMAFFTFAEAILEGRPIDIFNDGRMQRDFTYAGDVAEAVIRLFDHVPDGHRIINIGSGRRVPLLDFVAALETTLGCKAEKRFKPHHASDMVETWADISRLQALTGYVPPTPVAEGVARFADWYKSYRQMARAGAGSGKS